MFTLKVIQQSTTNIRTVKEVTIARKGSKTWEGAFSYVKEAGIETPDYVELLPELLGKDMETLQAEQILENGNREDVKADQCIAIICESADSLLLPGDDRTAGTAYTFIYEGDEVYVMNQNGSTIEAVK